MKIFIITTENKQMIETGFGLINSCLSMKVALEDDFEEVTIKSCQSKEDLDELLLLMPDVAILAVQYIHIEDEENICLSQYFEEAGITYTGSTREVLETVSNNITAKNIIFKHDIKTPGYTTVTPGELHSKFNECVPYPQFIKPLNTHNGCGVDEASIVHNFDEFVSKSTKLFAKYGSTAISEKFLSGREFTVAVLHNALSNDYIAAPIEILPPLNLNNIRMLDEKVMFEDNEALFHITEKTERENLEKMAIDCFKVLGARDFGLIDIKMDEKGICHFLEINLTPNITKGSSYYPICFEMDKEFSYEKTVSLLVANAVTRATLLSESLSSQTS